MGYRQAKMLEDINGDLIPQYWDVAEQKFKPLTNDPQDVRVTGSIGEDFRSVRYSNNEFPAGTIEDIMETDRESILDTFSFYLDDISTSNMQFILELKRKSGDYHRLPTLESELVVPKDIKAVGSNIYAVLKWDEESNSYSVGLQRPVHAPRGFRLRIRNQSSGSTYLVKAVIAYRRFE